MEPEERLDQHVEGGGQIVAAADVAEFVGQDGFQLRIREAPGDARGQQQDRAEEPTTPGSSRPGAERISTDEGISNGTLARTAARMRSHRRRTGHERNHQESAQPHRKDGDAGPIGRWLRCQRRETGSGNGRAMRSTANEKSGVAILWATGAHPRRPPRRMRKENGNEELERGAEP